MAAVDFKAKVKGGYAPTRLHVKAESELRVAGSTPLQLDQSAYEHIAELLAKNRALGKSCGTPFGPAGLGDLDVGHQRVAGCRLSLRRWQDDKLT